MTKAELIQAKQIAMRGGLMNVDDSALHGFYNSPNVVHTTIVAVARTMSDFRCLNGQWDSEALDEFCRIARKRIQII